MEILSLFESSVPEITNYSYDKIIRYTGHKKVALKYPYVRVNAFDKVSFLIFDVDEKFRDTGLTPSFIVVNPKNQHYHAFYALQYPVSKRNNKAWNFIMKVSVIYKNLLNSDRVILNQKLMTHNPFNERWQFVPLNEKKFTLSQMYSDAMDLVRVFGLDESVVRSNYSTNSRNCLIFEILRKCNFDSFDEYLAKARNINPQVSAKLGKLPLPDRELVTIARSVWKYKQRQIFR